MSRATLYVGDAIEVLRTLPAESVQCCVTSPPYWGLRDYGVQGQMGLEATPAEYVERLVRAMREVHRVLAGDGTLWLNMGDSFVAAPNSGRGWDKSALTQPKGRERKVQLAQRASRLKGRRFEGLKPKDMVGLPWTVALALRADGWWLRSDIIWSKKNCMPESVKDRPSRNHEYVFLLSTSARYYYNAERIAEPASPNTHARYARGRSDSHKYADGGPGNQTIAKSLDHMRRPGVHPKAAEPGSGIRANTSFSAAVKDVVEMRNARSVWEITTQPYSGAHFATFPEELARRCVVAGSKPSDVVLDPFGGSGTVAAVAVGNGRQAIHIDLNPKYLELARNRIGPMLCDVEAIHEEAQGSS